MNIEIIELIAGKGIGAMLALLMIYFGYRLLDKHGTGFVEAQNQMAVALGKQAESMGSMKDAVQEFVNRDQTEHREILMAIQVLAGQIKDLTKELRGD